MPIFRLFDLERMLIYQIFFLWKSAIFHSIKLPFDVQAAEKNLTCYLVFIILQLLLRIFLTFFGFLKSFI